MVCLVKAYSFAILPLFALALLMAMLVGNDAWWPFLRFLTESAPILFQLAFCVLLPSILVAIGAAYGLSCVVNVKASPTVSLVLVYRVSRHFWPVASLWVVISRYLATQRSTWDSIPCVKASPTVSLVLVYRVSRHFWPVASLWVVISRYLATQRSTWDSIPCEVKRPAQITLLTSIGLTSSARRLQ